ncbi:MAG: ATP-grasp domain-containing protein [Candidatus Brocadiales bacterium]|nr:ATP-grasp domain-containing protein [Candidatus Brocadiales bacterium]
MTVEIKNIPGQLPTFWDRNVIFFANMHSIFYDNIAGLNRLKQQIRGVDTYGGRLIPIINILFKGDNNLLVLEKPPDQTLLRYFEEDLNLSLPKITILSHSVYDTLLNQGDKLIHNEINPTLTMIHNHNATWVDGFVSDSILMNLAKTLNKPTISSQESSKKGNNKLLLHNALSEKGFPVFDTLSASSPDDVPTCIATLRNKGYKNAVVKAQIGASGIGMTKLSTDTYNSNSIPEHFFFEGPCMVQGWLDETITNIRHMGSPSIQIFLNDSTVSLYDITEQILNTDSVHQGNLSPPPYFSKEELLYEELFRQATAAGSWLHELGYRGTASVDFLVIEHCGSIEVRVCEINARITGATYPSVIARHFLPHDAWLMRNVRFARPLKDTSLLKMLDQAGYLFRPGMQEGVLPINFNLNEDGSVAKGQFLCLAKNLDDCLLMLTQIESILPLSWHYDRD